VVEVKSIAFANLWHALGDKRFTPVEEYRFHDKRRWRFDYAFVPEGVAVEIEGGVYSGGGHTRGKHYQSDCEKYNTATLMGWRVLRYTTVCLRERPVQIVEEVQEALRGSDETNT
jgi:very-short-patch-repair endonuclease